MSLTINSPAEQEKIAKSAENTAIRITDHAAQKIYDLMVEENNLDLKLRVYITGGGCSGFEYGFAFEQESQADDAIFTKHIMQTQAKVCVIIDPLSLQYLTGAEIDYVEDTDGERFVIRNPNAQSTCGCGSSFSI